MRYAKKDQIDSIVFDDRARLEFLTGFRKRKLQKKEAAKSKAKERERRERLEARRENRRALRERAQENARLVENAFKRYSDGEAGEEEAAGHMTSDKGKGKAAQKFEGEEQLATVTIVEDFDPEALRHGAPGPLSAETLYSQSDSFTDGQTSNARSSLYKDDDLVSNSFTSPGDNPIVKRKAVRQKKTLYEMKAVRKAERIQQLARKLEKADLAGRKPRQKEPKEGDQ